MSHFEDENDDCESLASARFELAIIGDSEDLENYEAGGFHPVHLDDRYDGGRYHVIHKLGSGGFSTVWLAYDIVENVWVALKICLARDSPSIEAKAVLSHELTSKFHDDGRFITYKRFFHIDGPNGRHLCLVLPLLGPSAYQVSHYRQSRMEPWLARHVALQTTKSIADLHSQGLCHGDLTPKNIVFRIENLDQYDQEGIYRLFGTPETGVLETFSGEIPGPEAPQYIVKALDFLSCEQDLIRDEICLIDFDQSFLARSPPEKILGIPVEFLAPEVAVGHPASPASDIWALGCSIMRLRSGDGLFTAFDVQSPVDLTRAIVDILGDLPPSWGTPLFDRHGKPTKDETKGVPACEGFGPRSMSKWVSDIWDKPETSEEEDNANEEENAEEEDWDRTYPYPPCYAHKFWKPAAIKVQGIYLDGYNDTTERVVETLPKIAKAEVDLLYDLISKILVYEPTERPTATELLQHPWFHIDER